MSYVAWGVLLLSAVLLVVVLFRHSGAFQWIGRLCLQVALAVFSLYIINLLSGYTHLELPLNAVTVGVVGLLGVPGLGLLVALKLWVI